MADIIPMPIAEHEPDIPEPVPLQETGGQPYRKGMLPAVLEDWALDVAHRTDTPPDMACAAAVVAAGFAIGRKRALQPKPLDSFNVPPMLWGVLLVPSGMRKSAVLGEMTAPIQVLEQKEAEQNHDRMAEYEAYMLAAQIEEKQAKHAYEKALEASDETAISVALQDIKAAKLKLSEPPPAIRLKTEDFTYEKLADMLASTNHGVMIERDEIGHFIHAMGEEKNAATRAFLLWAYQPSRPYIVDRMGRKARPAKAGLSVIGAAQPATIRRVFERVAKGEQENDGFLQRFQIMVMPNCEGYGGIKDALPNVEAKERYHDTIERLYRLQWRDNEPGNHHIMHYDKEAQAIYWDWAEEYQQMKAEEVADSAFLSHISRYDATLSSLALIFQLVENPNAMAVGKQAIMYAYNYIHYLKSHAEIIYGAHQTSLISMARRLVQWHRKRLKKGTAVGRITAREVAMAKALGRGITKASQIAPVLRELEQHGYLMPTDSPKAWQWNPKITPADSD